MGGNRPWTARRAVSLAALVAVLLGAATGVSHIGHSTISGCLNRGWWVVVGNPQSRLSTATENSRAAALVPSACANAAKDTKAGWLAYSSFSTATDAQAYLQQLVSAGYAKTYGFQPYVMQAPAQQTP